jgi:hypothetical protein
MRRGDRDVSPLIELKGLSHHEFEIPLRQTTIVPPENPWMNGDLE